jgi:hypothetical protein
MFKSKLKRMEIHLNVQESIKSSQQWFTACQPVQQYAYGLVALMARRLISLIEYEKQLHIIYLANDILFKA